MTKVGYFRMFAVMAAVLLAAVAMAVAARSSQAGGKPDLVVTSAHLTSRNYVFTGERSKLSFTDTTKNRGSAAAGQSKSVLGLKRHQFDATGLKGAVRDVPRLKTGEADAGGGSASGKATKSQTGDYWAVVCADALHVVDESREGNNCTTTDEQDLYIIPRSWTGTVTGRDKEVEGVTETWTANPMTFEFDGHPGGFFRYTAHGDVTYSISGTDAAGCTWSGGGTITVANTGHLNLFEDFSFYEGMANVDPFYPITRSCPGGGESTIMGPLSSVWFDTNDFSATTTRFGLTSLKDTYNIPSTGTSSIHYAWNLTAD